MKYFCSYSYICENIPCFGNAVIKTPIDPYDSIEEFRDKFEEFIDVPQVVLLFYKKVKS